MEVNVTDKYRSGQLYDSNRSRRQFLQALGWCGAGAAAYLSGCHHTKSPSDITLKFFGTGTLDIGQDGWSRLEHDLGYHLRFEDNQNDPGPVITQMISLTAAEDFDLGGLQGGAERELAEAGKILPWDLGKIPNWNQMWPWARSIPYTQHNGQQYGLPVVINADSMIYLPKHTGVVDSYAAIFDKKLRGKTAMEDAWINSVIFTAIYLKENSIQKIVQPGDLTVDELGAVMEFLIEKKRDGQFRTFWNGWEQGLSLILREEVYVMTGWEPIVFAARKKGVDARYAVPKEGYEGWSNDLLLHIGAQTHGVVDAAHNFANWELSGFYGCSLSKLRGYVVPSDSSVTYAAAHPAEFDLQEQRSISENVVAKFEKMKGGVYWQNVRPKNYKLYEDWWNRLRMT
jgi:putative spermidine/putrescine transport system substrate-binding protein